MYVVTNSPNFKKIHRRKREKIYCQFCSFCLCWRRKNRKTLMFYFERNFRHQRACNGKTIGSHLDEHGHPRFLFQNWSPHMINIQWTKYEQKSLGSLFSDGWPQVRFHNNMISFWKQQQRLMFVFFFPVPLSPPLLNRRPFGTCY